MPEGLDLMVPLEAALYSVLLQLFGNRGCDVCLQLQLAGFGAALQIHHAWFENPGYVALC